LKESGITIYLRHASPDLNAFDQIFRFGHYEPPDEVERRLAQVVPPLQVVDLGANVGFFGAFTFGRYPSATVVAFEPAPENLELLNMSVAANPECDWSVVAAAATTEDGEVPFTSGLFTNSRVAETEEATTSVPCVDVFPYVVDVDVLKIDIEGSEWAILEDERFRSIAVPVVALEYHSELCPAPDPRTHAESLLRRAGYDTEEAEFAASPGHGMIWAWKAPEKATRT
jgi:FkbM family methyltransferase